MDEELTRLPGDSRTRFASTPTGTGPGSESGRDLSPSDFTPGTILASRFRIVAPLGKGGMGEVYRADDLKLEQTVALKLLPEDVAQDPARLAQFHNEVRVARTISHRNVCRMYDIGDTAGRPFLTMEYVSGEDLASLLRRIGRFPQDKAIEVARQICAGLAAAHERGVLHRDLKPANVMIDGEGHARLTDFGLAAVAGRVDNIRAGTPAYMAPEQLAGREVTVRSDIYALGLVLFELFTGKRVFEAKTLNELLALHESGSTPAPSSVVRDLDPHVERVILRCLDRDPAKRPPSALAVSAALPGGDQLTAALAAGETPSPEMVAAAGEQSALQPGIGLALVALTLVMLALLVVTSQRYSLMHRIPLPRSNDSLRDRAQELLERAGYADAPADTATGWSLNRDYLSWSGRTTSADTAWPALPTGRTGTLTFWYRTSPIPIVPSSSNLAATTADPPFVVSEMRLVRLDAHGRLAELHAIPRQVDDGVAAPAASIDWTVLFEAAGLPFAAFHAVEPRWLPRNHADARFAWEGPLPDVAGVTARVEAASSRGRPIFFSVIGPWTQPARDVVRSAPTLGDRIGTVADIVGITILVGSVLLARRHARTGRGDRTGAWRTAAVVFTTLAAGWVLRARHYTLINLEYARLMDIVALTLVQAAIAWSLYMAFEPYVRRFWPQLLIGWTRLLSGRVRDPLVGRDVLAGAAAGAIAAMLVAGREIIPHLLGRPIATPQLPSPVILLGARFGAALLLEMVRRAFFNSLQVLCLVVFVRLLVRRTWLVLPISTILILPIAISGTFAADQLAIELPIVIVGIWLVFGTLLRFGLLALVVMFYTFLSTEVVPFTLDGARPYVGASIVLLLAIAGVSAYGFYASRGDEPLLGQPVLD